MQEYVTASIIIPTLERDSCLTDCLESIGRQTFKDYEVILVTEKGELSALRNQGAKRAKGEYLIFIDDDVVCSPRWLESIVGTFRRRNVAGVSGPAYISSEYRRNRDIFRFRGISKLYDLLFLDGKQRLPGHFTKSGAWTTGACRRECDYEGSVEFLEACNSAYRRDVFQMVGGFDEAYRGVGDWSEPDLSFRIRKNGYELWFSRDAVLEHRPSKSGAFKKRSSDSGNRMANYELFSKRWIKPHWKHSLYKQFMRSYYWIKETQNALASSK